MKWSAIETETRRTPNTHQNKEQNEKTINYSNENEKIFYENFSAYTNIYIERESSSNFNLESVSGAKILPLIPFKSAALSLKWNILRFKSSSFSKIKSRKRVNFFPSSTHILLSNWRFKQSSVNCVAQTNTHTRTHHTDRKQNNYILKLERRMRNYSDLDSLGSSHVCVCVCAAHLVVFVVFGWCFVSTFCMHNYRTI